MNLSDLQAQALDDCERWFPTMYNGSTVSELMIHFTLGIVGEGGEVAELIKKANRKGDVAKEINRSKLGAELSDVLMYIFDLAEISGIDLESELEAKRLVNNQRLASGEWGG